MTEQRFLLAGGVRYPVRITLESRRDVRASIGRHAVSIRLPRGLPARERADAIARMLRWAERTVERRGLTPRARWRSFADGERFAVDGREYTLRLEETGRRTGAARLQDGVLRALLPRGLAPDARGRVATLLISRCLARDWLADTRALVEAVNRRAFGRQVSAVRLKYLRASWGSCSRRGAINLSTRLLLAPRVVREYVCVHELAHLVERGHTPAFWQVVEGAMPDWRTHALWLRRNGDKLWF